MPIKHKEPKFVPLADASGTESTIGDIEREFESRELVSEIEKVLRLLPPREAFILRRYYGLNGYEARSSLDIGLEMGVTGERVRQLRNQALARIRGGKYIPFESTHNFSRGLGKTLRSYLGAFCA
jgi:DNA-directed RNA polymerase sigma subunit (sigma70/sigma32)